MKAYIYLFSFIFLSIFANFSSAQSPNGFTYQAVLRNNAGAPLAETEIVIRISLLQGAPSGTISFMETHSVVSNKHGLVNLNIGDGNSVTGNLDDIDWSTGPYFIKIEIDLSGESNYTELSTSQILSVPYALYAKTVGNVDFESISNKPFIPVVDDYQISDVSLWSSYKTNSELLNKISVTEDQTIYGNKTFENSLSAKSGIDAKNNRITNVASPVNPNDAVNKAIIDALLLRIERLEHYVLDSLQEVWITDSTGKTYDVEGNEYKFNKIGSQVWMAENLKTAKYSNGEDIATTDPFNKNITYESQPAYQWVYGGNIENIATYGRLYTWYAVNDPRNVCPTGWRVPTDNDMSELENFLGGSAVAGGKLKETGYNHWASPNTGATNSSGFTAVAGGYRSHAGGNTISGAPSIGHYGWYWTCTSINNEYANSRRIQFDNEASDVHTTEKYDGVSVRCIKN